MLASERQYLNGRPHDRQAKWRQNGTCVYEAYYDNGRRHGTHIKWDKYGRLVSSETYLHGRRHGPAFHIEYNNRGEVFRKNIVEFDSDQMVCATTFRDDPFGFADLSQCVFIDGDEYVVRQAVIDGDLYVTTFKNAVKNGDSKMWDCGRLASHRVFADGIQQTGETYFDTKHDSKWDCTDYAHKMIQDVKWNTGCDSVVYFRGELQRCFDPSPRALSWSSPTDVQRFVEYRDETGFCRSFVYEDRIMYMDNWLAVTIDGKRILVRHGTQSDDNVVSYYSRGEKIDSTAYLANIEQVANPITWLLPELAFVVAQYTF